MNVQGKTFPIRTTNVWLDSVRKAAEKENVSMHEFIINSVEIQVRKTIEENK